jgi:hypothetical protein
MKSAQFLLAIGLKATNPLIVITKKYPTRHVISLFASSRWGAVVILTTSVMIGLRRVGRLALSHVTTWSVPGRADVQQQYAPLATERNDAGECHDNANGRWTVRV